MYMYNILISFNVVPMYMDLVMITWDWITLSGLIPEENCVSQQWLITYSSSSNNGILMLSLFRSSLGNHVVEISWVQLFCHVLKTLSNSRPLKFFCLVFQNILWAIYGRWCFVESASRGCVLNSNLFCILASCGYLWKYSDIHKRHFFDEG